MHVCAREKVRIKFTITRFCFLHVNHGSNFIRVSNCMFIQTLNLIHPTQITVFLSISLQNLTVDYQRSNSDKTWLLKHNKHLQKTQFPLNNFKFITDLPHYCENGPIEPLKQGHPCKMAENKPTCTEKKSVCMCINEKRKKDRGGRQIKVQPALLLSFYYYLAKSRTFKSAFTIEVRIHTFIRK